MFCYQCQETAGGTGCIKSGVCGKNGEVSNLQDLLVYTLKGMSYYTTRLREKEILTPAADTFIMEALFSTITNVNFDPKFFYEKIRKGLEIKNELKSLAVNSGIDLKNQPDAAAWYSETESGFAQKAESTGILETQNEDIRSLRELLIYGIKGIAAYADHAGTLGQENNALHAFMQKGLAATLDDGLTADDLVSLVMDCGKHGVDVMALLDAAHTGAYGTPEITKVNIGVRNNPGILVSGHDLKDLEELLDQTQGKGVDVYTHGEMLPAHYYPSFKKYENFVGNYGNGWWKQKEEFETFNGPVLFTTNCIVPPKESYKARIYTTGNSGYPGCAHIPGRPLGGKKDFSAIIEHALRCAPPVEIESGEIIGGFAHAAVISLAGAIIDAVNNGSIKRFFVMAGCDGRSKGRDYYTEFAKNLPSDTVILTAGCAKYRYNKLELGTIGGIPRVLDAGQCNDSYSLAVIALKLKEAFGLDDINDLPISYNIAWYEQKAVIVLLALLYLGVKNIHLGPTLPAFLSPNVANVLIEKFGIAGIGTVEGDIAMFMGADKKETSCSGCSACS